MWNPQVADIDCRLCLKYEINIETGIAETDDATGEPLERLPADADHPQGWAPCRLHAIGKRKEPCPKGTPENPASLTERNERAYEHYKECEATNQWPDDGIVRRHAAIIRSVERDFHAHQQEVAMTSILIKAMAGER